MKFTKLMLSVGTLALAVASAASNYNVTITTPTKVGDQELKPGAYTVEMLDSKAVFKMKKTTVEVPAAIETVDKKFSSTALEISSSSLKGIELGGTKTKIVIKSDAVGKQTGR